MTERSIRYQFSLRSLLLAMTTLAISFGLLRMAFSSGKSPALQILAGLVGLLLCGGVVGAAVGHAVKTAHGSMARRGAIVGAIAFAIPMLLYVAFYAWLVFTWLNQSV